jgi:DNA primase
MSLSPQFLDEIRARTSLSTVIGRTVKLQRAGREWKAPCPFHKEKTPSFYVNDDKGFYHCFGCTAHGDAIRWLTDARGLPFMDAVKELADAAGMEVPAADPQAQQKAEKAAGLHEVMEAAQRWFEDQLNGVDGAEARAYLDSRGIADETRRRFGFGYAPDSRGKLRTALKGFGNDKLVDAGLLILPDGDREPYDRFRGRLMFPIRDRRGRVIAFSGRILGSGEPKYLNSPDTPLFDKGRTLFNLDKAAPASRDAKRVIVVEGQMDVIALDQAGFPEAVAPLGTALTETQLGLLWRLSPSPLLCFDGDSAGQKAAVRAARRALPEVDAGHTLSFVSLPPGKDPDDVIREFGRAALAGFLARAEPLAERLWRAEIDESPVATPEDRAAIKQRLLDLAAEIKNPHVRDQYRQDFSDRFWDAFGWGKQQRRSAVDAIVSSRAKRPGFDYLVRRAILLGFSRYPDVLATNYDLASRLEFTADGLNGWFEILTQEVFTRPDLTEDLIEEILEASDVGPIEKRDLARDLAFSFFRKHDPERGRADLRDVLATLVAEQEVDRALAEASEKFKARLEAPEWEGQQRLLTERTQMRERLSRMLEEAQSGAARNDAPEAGGWAEPARRA